VLEQQKFEVAAQLAVLALSLRRMVAGDFVAEGTDSAAVADTGERGGVAAGG
jgi:hypothetical protein